MRWAARTDKNDGEITLALRRFGYVVEDTTRVGGGFPDKVVGCPWGQIVFIEIKRSDLPPSRQKLRPKQEKFRQRWARFPVLKVVDCQDCFEQLERLRREWEISMRPRQTSAP